MVKLLCVLTGSFEALVTLESQVSAHVDYVVKKARGERLRCVEDEVFDRTCNWVKHHIRYFLE